MKQVAGAQRAAVESAETALERGGRGAQNARHIEAAGDGEIGADADARGAERDPRPSFDDHRVARTDAHAGRLDSSLAVRAGQRNGSSPTHGQLGTEETDLQDR